MSQVNLVSDNLQAKFSKIDAYISDALLAPDAGLESALEANHTAELDAIDVAPNQGHLLYQLAKLARARRILEVGTLGGYSALWLAKAVGPSGRVVTLELEERHAEVARSNIKRAGFEDVVEVRVGPALDTLKELAASKEEPFDFVFIDADKTNNVGYFKAGLELSHVGAVIIVDNIGRRGRLADLEVEDASLRGTRQLFEYLKGEKRVEATAVQTVGSKGWDGFLMATIVA